MNGAISIINATATGIGCSLATTDTLRAQWQWGGDTFDFAGGDDRLAVAAYWHLAQRLGRRDGARIRTTSTLPPARGLKTSSAAAAAMLDAGMRAHGGTYAQDALIHDAVAINRKAGTTLTGAYDDQVAVVMGGCHITDNHSQRIEARIPIEPWHIAVWVPDHALPKAQIAPVDPAPARAAVHDAIALARRGDVPAALTVNGEAYTRLYQDAGLPISDAPVSVALAAGARGAGLSGTGPSVAALFDAPIELPAVPGGRWHWTRAQEAA